MPAVRRPGGGGLFRLLFQRRRRLFRPLSDQLSGRGPGAQRSHPPLRHSGAQPQKAGGRHRRPAGARRQELPEAGGHRADQPRPHPPPELEDDEEPRPGRTALIASACTALVFIAGIVIFLTLRGGAQSGTPTPSAAPSAPAVSAAPTPTPPASSASPSDSPSGSPSEPPAGTSSGDLGDYHVEIQDAFLASDFEGNPAIIITYTWVNNSGETVSALSALSEKAFQNGVQIDRAVVYSRDTPGYDSGTASRSIRPGAESEVQCAYTLRDRVSTVEFEVTEFLGLSDSMVSMDFDPQALNAVE